MITFPRCLRSTCGGGLYCHHPSSFSPFPCRRLWQNFYYFPTCLCSNFGGGLFCYRIHSFRKSIYKQSCFIMIIFIIMSDFQVLTQLSRNSKYQPFSSNLNDVKFKKEFADASTSFKTILKKKVDALGTWKNVSIQTVIKSRSVFKK